MSARVAKFRFLFFLSGLFLVTAARADTGMVNMESKYSASETLDRLEQVLEKKGMKIFARIDHSAGAKSAGHELKPTQLLIFGNPSVGTPLMKCQRSVAIDLPQKMLAWEDENGQVWLSYNDPAYLKTRHGIDGCETVLKKVTGALKTFADKATQ